MVSYSLCCTCVQNTSSHLLRTLSETLVSPPCGSRSTTTNTITIGFTWCYLHYYYHYYSYNQYDHYQTNIPTIITTPDTLPPLPTPSLLRSYYSITTVSVNLTTITTGTTTTVTTTKWYSYHHFYRNDDYHHYHRYVTISSTVIVLTSVLPSFVMSPLPLPLPPLPP